MTSGVHTFVFADLANFTAYTEAHGDEAAGRLAVAFAEETRALAQTHDAHFVKSLGDGVLLAPHGAFAAICLGLDLTEQLGTRDELTPVRIGMHTGPAVEHDGDWFGAAVNIAARVGALADAREVLLTAETASQARPTGVELDDLGEQSLRHVGSPVRIYRARRIA